MSTVSLQSPVSIKINDIIKKTPNLDEALASLLASATNITNADADEQALMIVDFIDARGLACPVPLLKSKVALKKITTNQFIYMVASDANTLSDVQAFCQHANYVLYSEHSCVQEASIYHFIIGKRI